MPSNKEVIRREKVEDRIPPQGTDDDKIPYAKCNSNKRAFNKEEVNKLQEVEDGIQP